MSGLVRHTEAYPITEDFASAVGTPLVINTNTGALYVLAAGGVIAAIGPTAAYAVGTMTVPTGRFLMWVKRFQVAGSTQRVTLQGTARLSVYN